MKIAFLLGSPNISGGSYVIFEYAVRLNRMLDHQIVIITDELLSKSQLMWHVDALELKWCTYNDVVEEKFDLVIATWWRTVYEIYRVKATHYCYFVQSIESKFYKENEAPLRKLADSTYLLNLPVVTEATWIKNYLAQHYNIAAVLVRNGIRKDIYSLDGQAIAQKDPNILRVLVEGPLAVDFKNVERTLALCKKSAADEVWLLTSSQIIHHPLADKVFSQVPIFQTPSIYRSCDIIVKLSYVEGMFGPPLEMFHCGGTAIAYNVTGHDEYMQDGYNCYIVEKDNEQKVIDTINHLKKNSQLLKQLKQNALQTANSWHGWDMQVKEFEQFILNVAKSAPHSQEQIALQSNSFFEWYRLSEDYKLALDSASYLKKMKHKLCALLKRIKHKLLYCLNPRI